MKNVVVIGNLPVEGHALTTAQNKPLQRIPESAQEVKGWLRCAVVAVILIFQHNNRLETCQTLASAQQRRTIVAFNIELDEVEARPPSGSNIRVDGDCLNRNMFLSM